MPQKAAITNGGGVAGAVRWMFAAIWHWPTRFCGELRAGNAKAKNHKWTTL